MPAFGRLPLAYEYVRQGKHTTIIFKFQIPRKKRVEFTRLDTKIKIMWVSVLFILVLWTPPDKDRGRKYHGHASEYRTFYTQTIVNKIGSASYYG